jgi:hypothetical protein
VAELTDSRKESVQDRRPGWFVESRVRHRRSVPRWITGLRAFGLVLLIPGLYFALVPWGDCGISLMGRYDHSSPPDVAATAFTVCWNQAQNRRLWAAIFVVTGFLVLGIGSLMRWRIRRNRASNL